MPSYWVLDRVKPGLVAWEPRDGAYVEIADVAGEERFRPSCPSR